MGKEKTEFEEQFVSKSMETDSKLTKKHQYQKLWRLIYYMMPMPAAT